MIVYDLAKVVSPCDEETKKFCLTSFVHCTDCNKAIYDCPYAMRENPLCTNNSIQNCNRRWVIKNYNGKTYIFYYCNRCDYLIKGKKSSIDKLLEDMDDKTLIYGNELKKLVKTVFKNTPNTTDIERTIDYFEKKFKEKIIETIDHIRDSKFLPNPGKMCEWCDFRSICEHRSV